MSEPKKIKDLDPKTNLGGLKVKTPGGRIGYWCSQWQKGVWLSVNPNLIGKVVPIFVESLEECKEWEINPKGEVNL